MNTPVSITHTRFSDLFDAPLNGSLIPPQYVKPFVKRQKNDMADAEAIAEAAACPDMRFVAVKSAEQQAQSMLMKTRQLFIDQRTQVINMLRGHLAEYGIVAPQGSSHIRSLETLVMDTQGTDLPDIMRNMCTRLFIICVCWTGRSMT